MCVCVCLCETEERRDVRRRGGEEAVQCLKDLVFLTGIFTPTVRKQAPEPNDVKGLNCAIISCFMCSSRNQCNKDDSI